MEELTLLQKKFLISRSQKVVDQLLEENIITLEQAELINEKNEASIENWGKQD